METVTVNGIGRLSRQCYHMTPFVVCLLFAYLYMSFVYCLFIGLILFDAGVHLFYACVYFLTLAYTCSKSTSLLLFALAELTPC